MELHSDDYARTGFDPATGILSIVWTADTAAMTYADFQAALLRLAEFAEDRRAPSILVDVSAFAFRPPPETGPWRAETVVPRYNDAGVKRFAYVHRAGADLPPAGPAPDGEAFETRHFAATAEAEAWLTGG